MAMMVEFLDKYVLLLHNRYNTENVGRFLEKLYRFLYIAFAVISYRLSKLEEFYIFWNFLFNV